MDTEYQQPWQDVAPIDDVMKRRLGINLPQLLSPLAETPLPGPRPAQPPLSTSTPSQSLAIPPTPKPPLAEAMPTSTYDPSKSPMPSTPLSEAERLRAQGQPKLGGIKSVLDSLARSFPLGAAIERGIPGSPGNYERRLGLAEKEETGVGTRRFEAARTTEQEAKAEQERAKAESLRKGTPAKPESLTQYEAELASGGVQEGDPRLVSLGAVKSAGQRETADKTPPTQHLMQPDGKTHVMERDPKTGQYSIDRGIAPQTFGEAGLYEPVELPAPGGGMQPGSFDKRTGKVKPMAPGQTVIPKAAQTEIDRGLSAARDADNRYKTMTQNQADALKGNQQAMLSLVANHIGMTLGAQKGARINQAVWNEAIASSPFLGRVESRFDSRGILSGVTLTPDQIQQMTELAKQKREIVWGQAQQAAKQYGVESTVKMPPDLMGRRRVKGIPEEGYATQEELSAGRVYDKNGKIIYGKE